jgi:hypothetical protein
MKLRSGRSADLRSLCWYSIKRLAGVGYMRIVHRVTQGKIFRFCTCKWKNLLVRRGSDLAGSRITRGNHTRSPSARPTSKILCPTLAYVTRATSDCQLPSFHGVSSKELLAWPARDANAVPGGGIVGTGNQQAVDDENQRARWPAYMRPDRTSLSLRKIIASN